MAISSISSQRHELGPKNSSDDLQVSLKKLKLFNMWKNEDRQKV